jgi:hypothetical protein
MFAGKNELFIWWRPLHIAQKWRMLVHGENARASLFGSEDQLMAPG